MIQDGRKSIKGRSWKRLHVFNFAPHFWNLEVRLFMQTKRRRPGVENAKSKLLRNMSRMLMEDATSRACWTPGAVKKRPL